jgi:hypothetical protein
VKLLRKYLQLKHAPAGLIYFKAAGPELTAGLQDYINLIRRIFHGINDG